MAGQASGSEVHKYYVVHSSDLPASCPNTDVAQWDLHPKVYLDLEPNVRKACPYCGAVYLLVND